MEKIKRYIHISTGDNKNIAVIGIELDANLIQKNAEKAIRQEIEKKLPTVLKEELTFPVKIRHAEFNSLIPVEGDFFVVVESEEEDYELKVNVSETFLY